MLQEIFCKSKNWKIKFQSMLNEEMNAFFLLETFFLISKQISCVIQSIPNISKRLLRLLWSRRLQLTINHVKKKLKLPVLSTLFDAIIRDGYINSKQSDYRFSIAFWKAKIQSIATRWNQRNQWKHFIQWNFIET